MKSRQGHRVKNERFSYIALKILKTDGKRPLGGNGHMNIAQVQPCNEYIVNFKILIVLCMSSLSPYYKRHQRAQTNNH
jgi:hypothetical protein